MMRLRPPRPPEPRQPVTSIVPDAREAKARLRAARRQLIESSGPDLTVPQLADLS